MIAFQPRAGLRFCCETDFSQHRFASLHFCTADGTEIPLHLSLRPSEGRVVLNRRDRAGWRRELQIAHRFSQPFGSLSLTFEAGGVRLEVDGQRLGRFDAFPRPDRSARLKLRRGFPGLHRIAGVQLEGGVLPPPSSDTHPEPAPRRLTGGRALWLSQRLEVIAPGPRPPVLLPGGETLDLLPLAQGGFGAVLPGRIWRHAEVFAPAPGLRFSRSDLVRLLNSDLPSGLADQDDFLALQLIEHARWSGLSADLTPPARAALGRLAARFGLTEFLAPGAETRGAPAPLPPLPAEEEAQQRLRLSAALMAALREGGDARDEALLSALRALPTAAERGLFLTEITESYCLRGGFDRLLAAASQTGAVLPLTQPPASDWMRAALFPWQAAAGCPLAQRTEDLLALTGGRAWIPTPALAEGMKRLLARPALPLSALSPLLNAWFGFHEAMAQQEFSRHGCLALCRFSAGLLQLHPALPLWLQERLETHWLACCALLPAFYDALEALGPPAALPPRLQEARAQFRLLCDPDSPPEAAEAAARAFEAWKTPGIGRFRRARFGPSGTAAPLSEAGGEDLLRHLLDPLSPEAGDLSKDARARAARSLPALWEGGTLTRSERCRSALGQPCPGSCGRGCPGAGRPRPSGGICGP